MREIIIFSVCFMFAFGGSAEASSVELIANGGFESGQLGAWKVADFPGGANLDQIGESNLGHGFFGGWYVPHGFHKTDGPASGTYYAFNEQNGSGAHVLYQDFVVPDEATALSLSFKMSRLDFSGLGPIDAGTLDFGGAPNQHARVDIVRVGAALFSVTESDIVMSLVSPGVDHSSYVGYSFILSGLLSPGGTYRLRFAEVDNQSNFYVSVDDVSLIADVSSVPLPSSALLLGSAIALFASLRRQRDDYRNTGRGRGKSS